MVLQVVGGIGSVYIHHPPPFLQSLRQTNFCVPFSLRPPLVDETVRDLTAEAEEKQKTLDHLASNIQKAKEDLRILRQNIKAVRATQAHLVHAESPAVAKAFKALEGEDKPAQEVPKRQGHEGSSSSSSANVPQEFPDSADATAEVPQEFPDDAAAFMDMDGFD